MTTPRMLGAAVIAAAVLVGAAAGPLAAGQAHATGVIVQRPQR
jgi:hypothetical protein